jgi:hypothetical protein
MENILSRHKLRDVIKIQHGAQLVNSVLEYDYMKEAIALS